MPATQSVDLFIELESLASGRPGLSSSRGAACAEAAKVCLEHNRHAPGVTLLLRTDVTAPPNCLLTWRAGTPQLRRSWADLQEATEHGAYGVAALLLENLLGMTLLQRSAKGPGFDYWVGPLERSDDLFQGTARLEVSGILRGQHGTASRAGAKARQVTRHGASLPAIVVVVEFGRPEGHLEHA